MKRINILYALIENESQSGHDIFINLTKNANASDRGKIIETLFQIMVVFKCIPGINYTTIYDGELQSLEEVTSFKSFFNKELHQGNNISDLTIKEKDTFIMFSVKTGKNIKSRKTDIVGIIRECQNYHITDYKIGLVVEDKNEFHIEKIHSPSSKQDLDTIIKNGLYFDITDIIKGIMYFREKFYSVEMIDSFIVNKRIQLILKFHQSMFLQLLITTKGDHCLSALPRSGKSIIILKYAEYLLKNKIKQKILIMTPVKGTIDSFKEILNTYTDFEGIHFEETENFKNMDDSFRGIMFCTTQFLKTSVDKKEKVISIMFDLIVYDECHIGGTTSKTKEIICC